MAIEIMHPPKAAVLKVAGINCDVETRDGLELAGASGSEIIHLNQFLRGEKSLDNYQILAIPGGFSFGDDFGAGRVMALELRHRFAEQLENHLQSGRVVLGICNGFQVLVQMGLLPFGEMKDLNEIDASLAPNTSRLFESRWVHLKAENAMHLPNGEVISLPVAHGEGRFIASDQVLQRIEDQGLVAWRYCTADGVPTQEYPVNPNGSSHAIAALIDSKKQIVGLMPHPERKVIPELDVNWRRTGGNTDGLSVLRQVVELAK